MQTRAHPPGLQDVFEGYCPPHYPDMRAAVEAFAERKFGRGGPFHPDTRGPWKESSRVRASAEVHSEEFKECVPPSGLGALRPPLWSGSLPENPRRPHVTLASRRERGIREARVPQHTEKRAGVSYSPCPSPSCPYSPECLVGVSCEVGGSSRKLDRHKKSRS
jgi:hypothetical protein